MPLTKCPRCKKLFDKVHSPVCPRCQADEDRDYDVIRALLDRSPNLNAEQVGEETGINLECVMRMINEGLISNVNLSASVKCGRCGAPAISMSRRLCQACLEKLNAEMAAAQSKIKMEERKSVKVGEYLHAKKAFEDKRR